MRIQLLAMLEVFAAPLRRRAGARHPCQVAGGVRDVLGEYEVGEIGEVLHADVPALIVPVVDQLARDETEFLARERRDAAIVGAARCRPVAASAGTLEELLAVLRVDLGVDDRLVFLF